MKKVVWNSGPPPPAIKGLVAHKEHDMNKHDWMDSPGNFWDRCGFLCKCVTVVALLLACCFTAAVLVGVLQ